MAYDVYFKRIALERVWRFIRMVPDEYELAENGLPDRKFQIFPRVMRALATRHSKTILHPSAVVAYFDGETTYQLFDDEKRGFDCFRAYYEVDAPVVYLTMNSIELVEVDDEDDLGGLD